MALIRAAGLAGLIYLAFALGYPEGGGEGYRTMTLLLIAGGAVGVFLVHRIIDASGFVLKLAVELAFLAAVALWVGTTMPQKSGKPPLAQWAAGVRPAWLRR